jgi:hypothetical protein
MQWHSRPRRGRLVAENARHLFISISKTSREICWSVILNWFESSSVATPAFTRSIEKESCTTPAWRQPCGTDLALLLRIANPPGAKQRGKLAQSRDMRKRISQAIRRKQHSEVSSLFSPRSRAVKLAQKIGVDSDLVRLLPQGARIRGTLKDKVFRATVRPNGTVRFKGVTYKSLSLAAYAAIKRPTNGWWFWQIERGRRNWIRLTKIRKAGTPVYKN